jgi:cytochrome b561
MCRIRGALIRNGVCTACVPVETFSFYQNEYQGTHKSCKNAHTGAGVARPIIQKNCTMTTGSLELPCPTRALHSQVMNRADRYSKPAVALHWLLALLIVGTFSFGLYMVDLPFSPARLKQYNWHKWAGMTILALSAMRLLWRLFNKPPALPSGMPSWQQRASHISHGAMYVLFFAIPLAGWTYSSALGFPIVVYGVIPMPDLVGKNAELAAVLKAVHKYLAYGLGALVLMHVAAALQHQFVLKDRLLSRMGWN